MTSNRLFDLKIQEKHKNGNDVQRPFFCFKSNWLDINRISFSLKKIRQRNNYMACCLFEKCKTSSRSTLFICIVRHNKKPKWKETHMRCFFDFALKWRLYDWIENRLSPPVLNHVIWFTGFFLCAKKMWRFAWQTTNRWSLCIFTEDQKNTHQQKKREKWERQQNSTMFITLIPSCLCEKM